MAYSDYSDCAFNFANFVSPAFHKPESDVLTEPALAIAYVTAGYDTSVRSHGSADRRRCTAPNTSLSGLKAARKTKLAKLKAQSE